MGKHLGDGQASLGMPLSADGGDRACQRGSAKTAPKAKGAGVMASILKKWVTPSAVKAAPEGCRRLRAVEFALWHARRLQGRAGQGSSEWRRQVRRDPEMPPPERGVIWASATAADAARSG